MPRGAGVVLRGIARGCNPAASTPPARWLTALYLARLLCQRDGRQRRGGREDQGGELADHMELILWRPQTADLSRTCKFPRARLLYRRHSTSLTSWTLVSPSLMLMRVATFFNARRKSGSCH